jgi:outer membrane murein-binding lipoprotein Lpp
MVGADVEVGTHRRREVSLVAVAEAEVLRRLQPVADAGFDIRGVSTPAMALTALSRQHRTSAPGSIAAYVALEAHATCVAIVRDGVLLFAREIAWGYGDAEPVETKLAAELRRSMLFFRQTFRAAVEVVVLCGGMANLRALTAPVGSALGLAVETLDSLTGLDASDLPEPAEAFRSAVSSLRVAVAPAAESGSRPTLLPASIRSARDRRAEIVRMAAALVGGVLLVGLWYGLIDGGDAASQVRALEARVAALESEAERFSSSRRTAAMAASREAALVALDSQGPRLSRFLEGLARTTPQDVALNEIEARAEGAHWRTVVSGMALTEDPAVGQAAVSGLLQRLSQSPYAGPIVQPPAFRLMSGRGGPDGDESGAPRSLPEGTTGVEFSAQFRVRK